MLRLLLLLTVLLSLLIPGCSPIFWNPDLTIDGGAVRNSSGKAYYWVRDDFALKVLVDDSMPEEFIQATREAVHEWNYLAGVTLMTVEVVNFSRPYGETTLSSMVLVSMKQLGKRDGAILNGVAQFVTYGKSSTHLRRIHIFYDNDLRTEWALSVALHELGHALTLDHDPADIRSIMYPHSVASAQYLMPDDVAYLLDVYYGRVRF